MFGKRGKASGAIVPGAVRGDVRSYFGKVISNANPQGGAGAAAGAPRVAQAEPLMPYMVEKTSAIKTAEAFGVGLRKLPISDFIPEVQVTARIPVPARAAEGFAKVLSQYFKESDLGVIPEIQNRNTGGVSPSGLPFGLFPYAGNEHKLVMKYLNIKMHVKDFAKVAKITNSFVSDVGSGNLTNQVFAGQNLAVPIISASGVQYGPWNTAELSADVLASEWAAAHKAFISNPPKGKGKQIRSAGCALVIEAKEQESYQAKVADLTQKKVLNKPIRHLLPIPFRREMVAVERACNVQLAALIDAPSEAMAAPEPVNPVVPAAAPVAPDVLPVAPDAPVMPRRGSVPLMAPPSIAVPAPRSRSNSSIGSGATTLTNTDGARSDLSGSNSGSPRSFAPPLEVNWSDFAWSDDELVGEKREPVARVRAAAAAPRRDPLADSRGRAAATPRTRPFGRIANYFTSQPNVPSAPTPSSADPLQRHDGAGAGIVFHQRQAEARAAQKVAAAKEKAAKAAKRRAAAAKRKQRAAEKASLARSMQRYLGGSAPGAPAAAAPDSSKPIKKRVAEPKVERRKRVKLMKPGAMDRFVSPAAPSAATHHGAGAGANMAAQEAVKGSRQRSERRIDALFNEVDTLAYPQAMGAPSADAPRTAREFRRAAQEARRREAAAKADVEFDEIDKLHDSARVDSPVAAPQSAGGAAAGTAATPSAAPSFVAPSTFRVPTFAPQGNSRGAAANMRPFSKVMKEITDDLVVGKLTSPDPVVSFSASPASPLPPIPSNLRPVYEVMREIVGGFDESNHAPEPLDPIASFSRSPVTVPSRTPSVPSAARVSATLNAPQNRLGRMAGVAAPLAAPPFAAPPLAVPALKPSVPARDSFRSPGVTAPTVAVVDHDSAQGQAAARFVNAASGKPASQTGQSPLKAVDTNSPPRRRGDNKAKRHGGLLAAHQAVSGPENVLPMPSVDKAANAGTARNGDNGFTARLLAAEVRASAPTIG